MKVIKVQKNLTVVFENGAVFTNSNCSDEMYNDIMKNQKDEDYVKNLLIPDSSVKEIEEKIEEEENLLNRVKKSKIIESFHQSFYMKSISELTLPIDLVKKILDAEEKEDLDLILSYKNFWTLVSMNPDSRVRTNLFWFLDRYGMTISRSGLFIAYRNAKLKKEGNSIDNKLTKVITTEYIKIKTKWKKKPSNFLIVETKEGEYQRIKKDSDYSVKQVIGSLDELYLKLSDKKESPTIYTDAHSGTTEIIIGKPVSIPREKCDPNQEHTCSKGLHVAGRSWLKSGYFGSVSMAVLVNPADVVAVPPEDNYGKMRTCSYYPFLILGKDEKGEIEDKKFLNGFEDDFISVIYNSTEINNKDSGDYKLDIPDIPELNRRTSLSNLENISKILKSRVND